MRPTVLVVEGDPELRRLLARGLGEEGSSWRPARPRRSAWPTRSWTSRSSTGDGDGLGLALARRLARATGGDVAFAPPSRGGGARLCVRLPA